MLAVGLTFAAKMFAGLNDECVVLVEKRSVGRKAVFEERANFVIRGTGVNEAVALEDAAGVGVDNENFVLSGVEKDGVGSLRTNAVNSQELLTELCGGRGKEFVEGALILAAKEGDKFLEFACFLAEITGGAN